MKTIHKIIYVLVLAIMSAPVLQAQGWIELPASSGGKDECVVTTQYMQKDGASVRSHTYRYHPGLRISTWVAYPLNASLIGKGSRGEGWHPYGGLSEEIQPSLYKGFSYGSGYDRGHQIPSADRLDKEINYETFTFINATPQRHEFNGGVWADLEQLVRSWAKRSDTLYVVTGAIPGKEWVADNNGKMVNVPKDYYKVVLRRNKDKKGTTHWTMCALLIPHLTESFPMATKSHKKDYLQIFAVTVEDLEKRTGETFFPNLLKCISEPQYKLLKQLKPDPWFFN